MDKREIDKLLVPLRELEGEQTSKVVLSLKRTEETNLPEIRPSEFASRREYRDALISRQRALGKQAIDGFVDKLESIGMTAEPAYLSNSIVVAGRLEELEAALSQPEVDDATLDFELDLIEPDRQGNTG